MLAAEIITAKLLKKGIKDFKVIEGWVIAGVKEEEIAHTWIELADHTIIDPTFEQFVKLYGKDNVEYGEDIKETFTPEEYLETCDFYGAEEEYKKWGYDRQGKKFKETT